jgi:hypothetical protein
MAAPSINVRWSPESRHRRAPALFPLCANNGHGDVAQHVRKQKARPGSGQITFNLDQGEEVRSGFIFIARTPGFTQPERF